MPYRPRRPMLVAGAALLAPVVLAFAGCTGSGPGLRGVGTTPNQSLAAAAPPQVVTSDFDDPNSTVADGDIAAQQAELNAAPGTLPDASQPEAQAASQPAPAGSPRKLVARQPRPAPQPVARQQPSQQPVATLQSVAPPPAASDRFTPQPQMGESRETAIRQMREKAAATDKQPPNVFDIPQSRTQPLDEAEREELRRRLEAEAEQNAENVTLEEALKRQKDADLLLKKADRHYNDALKSIEN